MKVTVIFGDTRVVVPCGQGDFLVSELIEKAVVRYRKAAGKSTDHYVHIHTLKSLNDGGILDLDDTLSDVVDNREQIVAHYEEHSGPTAPQGGDGTSGSSVGSASPDVFHPRRKIIHPSSIPVKSGGISSSQPAVAQAPRASPAVASSTNSVRSSPALYIDTSANIRGERPTPLRPMPPPAYAGMNNNDSPSAYMNKPSSVLSSAPDNRHSVEVTERDLNSGTGLQVLSVRRDSEPNIVAVLEAEGDMPAVRDPWMNLADSSLSNKPGRIMSSERSESSDDEHSSTSPSLNRFARDSSRQSLTGNNVLKWASAQERQQESHDGQQALEIQTDLHQQSGRKEPIGQSQSPGDDHMTDTKLVVLKNEDGPLGIHVVPHRDDSGRESGLVIHGIEPGGRVHRSGQFLANDVIVEINGNSLRRINFTEAQEVFRDALQTDEIRLRVYRPSSDRSISSSSSMQDSINRRSGPASPTSKGHSLFKTEPPPPPQRSPNTALSGQLSSSSVAKNSAPVSPEGHAPQSQADEPQSSGPGSQNFMQANTRKMGKKIYIELTKGPEGLGFSITTRDNPAGGLAPPIYVKNILPKGAAIADGRLKSGDRLLEVNNMDMTGKSQDEVVVILRSTKRGSTVNLCVSRLDASGSSSTLPRQMPKTLQEDVTSHNTDRQILTFNIPLNETGSAGLGISVKGKTSTTNGVTKDLGIFIKTVIHGGAASKDGRLQINDQLLSVNDDDLKKKANSEAMESLRKAMHTEGPKPGHIKLTIERKLGPTTSTGSTPEPWESSTTTTDSTVTGRMSRASTDHMIAATSQRAPDVTLSHHSEGELSTLGNTDKMAVSTSAPAVTQSVIDQTPNPVLDRITGGSSANKLRNESYHMATQEDSDGNDSYDPPLYSNQSTIPNPTQSHPNSNVMMIEEDNNKQTVLQQPRRKEEPKPKSRPLSTIGGVGVADVVENKQRQRADSGKETRSESPPADSTQGGDDSSNMNTFDREAFGRRSFSEKRKASNGKNKEVVAKVKALREEMKQEAAGSQANADIENTGPNLGLKKNSSFESLQAMVEAERNPAAEPSIYKPPNRVARGRGCNESFRAAVDRSYDPSGSSSAADHMDLVSEDSEFARQTPMTASFSGGELDSEKKKQKKAKNGGILGLFRLTKARKSLEERSNKQSAKNSKFDEKERSSSTSSSKTSQEPDKIQEYYKKMHEKNKSQLQDNHYSQPQPEFGTYPRGDRLRITPSAIPPPVPPHANNNTQDRAEHLASVRAQHQRRHNDRHGQYPLEDKEDFYERKIKEREKEWGVNSKAYGKGAEFNPRPKNPQSSGMSNHVHNRYSFYADPRYHDYHRSTQPAYSKPNDSNSNINSSAQYHSISDRVVAQRSPFINRTDAYNSLPKRDRPAQYTDTNDMYTSVDRGRNRYPPHDTTSAGYHQKTNGSNRYTNLDDPSGADNSIYAKVSKRTLSNSVSNPARV